MSSCAMAQTVISQHADYPVPRQVKSPGESRTLQCEAIRLFTLSCTSCIPQCFCCCALLSVEPKRLFPSHTTHHGLLQGKISHFCSRGLQLKPFPIHFSLKHISELYLLRDKKCKNKRKISDNIFMWGFLPQMYCLHQGLIELNILFFQSR